MERRPYFCLSVKTIFVAILFFGCLQSATAITVTLQNGAGYEGCADAMLREALPDAGSGHFGELHAGYEAYGNGGAVRSLLRFDVSHLPATEGWTASTSVSAVRLKLYMSNHAGMDFSSKTVTLHRVSSANKAWDAGASPYRHASEQGAVCWNFRLFDDTYLAESEGGDLRHQPWAGDESRYDPSTGNFSGSPTGSGCGVAGTDFLETALASATVSSSDVGSWITFEISDYSFISDWLSSVDNNEGFLVKSTDLETGTVQEYSTAVFASGEYATTTYRPKLELDLENYTATQSDVISYELPAAGDLSIIICNDTGKVIKELLHAQHRDAGAKTENWDCKNDPMKIIDSPLVVPDGQYTVKFLLTQGLQAEFLMPLGQNVPPDEQWPGDHVVNASIALDAGGFYVAARTGEAGCVMMKMTHAGRQLWRFHKIDKNGWNGAGAMCSDGTNLYALIEEKKIAVFNTTQSSSYTQKKTPDKTFTLSHASGWGVDGLNYDDIAVTGDGTLIRVSMANNSLTWMDASNGSVLSSASVTNPRGVAVDQQGNALVVTNNTVVKYTQGSSSGETVITGLSNALRLGVNQSNGDIYVIEYEPNNQVKRFSKDGDLLQTYGNAGGRTYEGKYDPAEGFYWPRDIAVHTDGSFWVSEHSFIEPRRVTHWSVDGEVLGDFYGGQVYATPSMFNPADPTDIWVEHGRMFIRCKVDYETMSWKVDGNYQHAKEFMDNSGGANPHYNLVNRGDDLFVCFGDSPRMFWFDEEGDSLHPVARLGWPRGSLPENLWTTELQNGDNPMSWSWADLDGNGKPSVDEITAYDCTIFGSPTGHNSGYNNYIDENLVTWGLIAECPTGSGPLSRLAPSWHTAPNGVPVPVLHADSLIYFGEGGPNLTDVLYGYWYNDAPPDVTVPTYFENGIDLSDEGMRYSKNRGMIRDTRGNYYRIYNYEFCPDGYFGMNGACYGAASCGGNRVAKWDPDGNLLWHVGRHAANNVPNNGEVRTFTTILGTAHGCIATADVRAYQYVWDRDGLYVGRLVEHDGTNKHPASTNLSDDAFNICDEQFGGRMMEITRDDIPGLNRGDVLFLGTGRNAAHLYRIHGWDNFYRMQKVITVENGKIVSQSDLPVAPSTGRAHAAAGRLSVRNSAGGAVSLSFSVDRSGPVSLELYDCFGRRVRTLVNHSLSAGTHAISWDKTGARGMALPAGYYVAKLRTGQTQAVRKVMVVRRQ